jgi:serine/threonine protein kinase
MTKEELGVEAGQVIAGKYRLQKLLGRGGMGSVWQCDHLELLSPIALKIIKPDVAKNKNSVARFMREAKASAMLRSPHVVQIFEHGTDGSTVYIAMELLEGESLLHRIKRKGKMSPPVVATVIRHVGKAMQKAHDAGIVHRDLKPDNIFIIEDDDEIVAKVLDFGIAKSSIFALNATGESPQTQTGALLGTPYYMSPEQATGQKDVDHRADLWAIGVLTFECLLGKRPYQSDSLGDLVLQICSRAQPVPSQHGAVPVGFDGWFAKAQQRDPNHRHQSARELTRELRHILTAKQPPRSVDARVAGPPRPRPSVPPPRPPSKAPLAMTAVPNTQPMGAPVQSATPFEQLSSGAHNVAEVEISGQHPAPLGLETLDPLAATTEPKRSRAWLGVGAATVTLIVAGFAALQMLGETRGAISVDEETIAAPAAETVTAEPLDAEPMVEGTAEPTEVVDLDEPTAEPTVEPSATAATPIPRPARPPRPAVPPKPKAPPPVKPRPSPSDDVLGI